MSRRKRRRKVNTRNALILVFLLTGIVLIGIKGVGSFFGDDETVVEEEPVVVEEEPEVVEEEPVEEEPVVVELQYVTDDCGETLVVASETLDERFTSTDSLLVLANKHHSLPEGYQPADLRQPDVRRTQETLMRDEAASALEKMFAAAESDGAYLYATSGFRNAAYQAVLFNNYTARDGACAAATYSSRPGHSDHQTGLTMDISTDNGRLYTGFEDTKEGQWLAAHAHEYGFIMRYPKDKEQITGYIYEPWHFRYIGVEDATAVYQAGENMSFEEYFNVY